ncbi:MAG: bifunctional DNA-formamidopyrimidine glycosylase/DNA-(apurinic or apyrimidinic site) lyase [Thermoleophilia bacterium]|nr:bifunctional DNA-formamidopyrimidine glycosylase/DNA-(apurinic or apyrimidinic site) lyase [Thermoleophilia bacterium]MDH3724940.1 bifunctional DNA-formamidopyrimidine glycosylase/DNA-(apurinic or apyrimidinic site) lyase [Thermoleophilia bacterium]
MPELPEVETIRSQLSERIPGRRIDTIAVYDEKTVSPLAPGEFEEAVTGQTILAVNRYGKYLEFPLRSGSAIALHLRMTGRLHWRPGSADDGTRFLKLELTFDDGSSLVFGDMRRFGRAWLLPEDGAARRDYWARKVGIEPLGAAFTAKVLEQVLDGRRGPIKPTLLNQSIVSGLGNMYVDEALFQAKIHPLRRAGSLATREIIALHRAMRDRLRVAVAHGGASIDSYRDGLGQRGSMQDYLKVHLHEGEACPRCGCVVVKTRVAQRGTYWCPTCQPEP